VNALRGQKVEESREPLGCCGEKKTCSDVPSFQGSHDAGRAGKEGITVDRRAPVRGSRPGCATKSCRLGAKNPAARSRKKRLRPGAKKTEDCLIACNPLMNLFHLVEPGYRCQKKGVRRFL